VRAGKPVRAWVLTSWEAKLGVTLLLRFGKVVSTVGWNVLGLQPVGVIFHKDKFSLLWYHLHAYECIFHCVYLIII
jgi:hypothetical protein